MRGIMFEQKLEIEENCNNTDNMVAEADIRDTESCQWVNKRTIVRRKRKSLRGGDKI